jgi:ADP-ribosylglycohydrolase
MTTHPVRHSLVAERKRYAEQVYAGVLGKIIGVCLGRPVEGRPYQDIADRFGEVGTTIWASR